MRPVLVRCENAALTFGSGQSAVVAVHGATCAVHAGESIAVRGDSGSGKSSLLHLMAGLERPTAGTVCWPDLPTLAVDDGRGPAERQPSGTRIGVVFQGPSLVPALDVTENVALPLLLSGTPENAAFARSRETLAVLGLLELAHKLPEELSGGQAQRVAVARVLGQAPTLVLADEPTGQLDHATGAHVLDVLQATVQALGAALVVTTHDEAVAARMSVVWTMREGRLDAGSARTLSPPAPGAPVPGRSS
jgi:putative ABC transport system ATP-binding protein